MLRCLLAKNGLCAPSLGLGVDPINAMAVLPSDLRCGLFETKEISCEV